MDNITTNGSYLNATLENKSGPLLHAHVINYVLLLLSLVIALMELVAVSVLQRCNRIPACSRIFSMSYFLSDAVGSLVFAVHQVMIFIFGLNDDIVLNSRIVLVGTMMAVSWASVAFMSLDRVVAIKINLKYNLYSSKFKIYLLVSFIWIVNIAIIAVAIVIGLRYNCISEYPVCDLWKIS